ncbi:MAG: hypothetical protein MI861_04240 [Pirellulales bacterium]|nr:hypothetical protein [Pirellulales bacterium]
MRNLIIIAVLLFAASMAGWFTVNREGDRTTIEINRNEIREDARRAIDRGREFLEQNDRQAQAQPGPWAPQPNWQTQPAFPQANQSIPLPQYLPQEQIAQQPQWQQSYPVQPQYQYQPEFQQPQGNSPPANPPPYPVPPYRPVPNP